MPVEKMIHYQFGGSTKIKLWMEKEVAAKLKMTVPELRKAIEAGGSGIPYHIHENRYKKTRDSIKFSHREYFFNQGCWEMICQMAEGRKS